MPPGPTTADATGAWAIVPSWLRAMTTWDTGLAMATPPGLLMACALGFRYSKNESPPHGFFKKPPPLYWYSSDLRLNPDPSLLYSPGNRPHPR